jgi:hypothetical protein
MIVLVQRQILFPRMVIVGAIVFFILFMVGFVKTSITLWGSNVGVNATCKRLVTSQPVSGLQEQTIAWLEASNICMLKTVSILANNLGSVWQAAWAFELITMFFLIYSIFLSMGVYQSELNRRERQHRHRRKERV